MVSAYRYSGTWSLWVFWAIGSQKQRLHEVEGRVPDSSLQPSPVEALSESLQHLPLGRSAAVATRIRKGPSTQIDCIYQHLLTTLKQILSTTN